MAIDFPASPTVGQEFTGGTVLYRYNGYGWGAVAQAGQPYVLKTGDTMSGALAITDLLTVSSATTAATINLDKSGSGQESNIFGRKGTLHRWKISIGDNAPETGSHTGSNFSIISRNDDGTHRSLVLTINRATGDVALSSTTASSSPTTGALTVAGGVGVGGSLFVGLSAVVGASTGANFVIVDGGGTQFPGITFRTDGATRFKAVVNSANAFIIHDADAAQGVQLAQNGTTWAAYSDARMAHKQNARTVSGLLDRLDRFRLVEFGEDHQQIGVLAQELYDFAPQLVGRGDDSERVIKRIDDGDVWTVKPSEAAFVALQLCKELHERIQQLKEKH